MNIKDIEIASYIKSEPVKRKNGYGLYYSPFRTENKPSFKIDYTKNVWYDFGLGKGGSIVDLVMELKQCTLCEAFRELEQGNFSFHWNKTIPQEHHTPQAQITKVVYPSIQGHLMNYCHSRGISTQVVCTNLKQVYYTHDGKQYFSLGMKNALDGWELVGLKRFKMVIGQKSYTFVPGYNHTEVNVFEGIFDYLSSLILGGRAMTPKNDCVILNSVVTLKQASERLRSYDRVHSFLDNDDAGRKCLSELMDIVGSNKVATYDFYEGYNDLNDYLISLNYAVR